MAESIATAKVAAVNVLIVFMSVLPLVRVASAQPALTPRVGAVIDADERRYFNLFPNVDGFSEGRLGTERSEGTPITITRDSGPDTTFVLNSALRNELRRYIERHEDPVFVINELNWDVLTGYVGYLQRVTPTVPTTVLLTDGQSIALVLAYADDGHVYFLPPGSDTYDWRESQTHLIKIANGDIAELGSSTTARVAAVVRSSVRRNLLTVLALGAVGILGNGTAEPRHPGFIGGVSLALAGGLLSVQAPTAQNAVGTPPYDMLTENALSNSIRRQALFRNLAPPDLKRRSSEVVTAESVTPSRPRTWHSPDYRVRLGVGAPYRWAPKTTYEQTLTHVLGGNGVPKTRELIRGTPWEADLGIRIVRGVVVGARYSRRVLRTTDDNTEYMRGSSVHPYLEYAIERRIGAVLSQDRSIGFSLAAGPVFHEAEISHVAAFVLQLEQAPIFPPLNSSHSVKVVEGAASMSAYLVLSRLAMISASYTYWTGSLSVPERKDIFVERNVEYVLQSIDSYNASIYKHSLRFGVSITIP